MGGEAAIQYRIIISRTEIMTVIMDLHITKPRTPDTVV
jgi:hypothetical protein